MADTKAKRPPTAGKGKGGALSGSFHGIPKPVLAVGGGLGAFFLYRFWKARQAAASTSATPLTANPAATGTDSGMGAFPGTGTGGGGGGGYMGNDPRNNDLLKQILAALTPNTTTTPGPGPDNSSPPVVAPAGQTAGQTAVNAGPLPTQQNLQSQSVPVAPQGSTATGAGGNPNGVAGTFNLPKGTVDFQPTAAVVNGKQVAYGVPNPGVAKSLNAAGGTLLSGAQLEQKGWTGVTPGAQYLLR